jgi:hypothetical protein
VRERVRGEGELIATELMSERRYIIRPCDRLTFGYYDEGRGHFIAQVDFLGLGSEDAVLVTDVDGSRLLATNPDLTCELPFVCWCLDDILPLLEVHGFMPIKEGEENDNDYRK